MKEDVQRCFFCDNIIIPNSTIIMSIDNVKNYFKKIELPFTIHYSISRSKIGNKILCINCETEIKRLIFSNNKLINYNENDNEFDFNELTSEE